MPVPGFDVPGNYYEPDCEEPDEESMSEMIERVATAIDGAVQKWQPGCGEAIKVMAARAAIEEIREQLRDELCITSGESSRQWREIDEALK